MSLVEKSEWWTPEQDQTLVRMAAEGVSASQVASAIGKSRSAVLGRAYRKKLQFKGHSTGPSEKALKARKKAARPKKAAKQRDVTRFTAEEDQTIREMAAAGRSGTDIGAVLNRHKSSVVQRARRLGTPLRGKDGPPKTAAPKVKAKKVNLRPGNIAGKKDSRTHDPEFRHVTPVVAVKPLMVALVDLGAGMCKFPVGDPLQPDFGFCGLHARESSYCKAHARLCYTAPEMRRKAA